eukprot:scaffold22647_cov145-Cylindrotheca_fusiformis.AAC.9
MVASSVTTAFSSQTPSSTTPKASSSSLSSYLDSLDFTNGSTMKPASYSVTAGKPYNIPKGDNSYTSRPAAAPHPQPQIIDDEFPFATAAYFEQLESKGPRTTADWGTPADATRKLCDDGTFRAGAWSCSQGGWPSPNGKAVTEVFYVLEGFGSLDDADGMRHYFGPGDNVIIPKGHSGRWDVYQPIRKVWAVNAHEHIEERGNPIRVQVDHYHTWAPQFLTPNTDGRIDPLYGSSISATSSPRISSSSKVFYDVGPTKVGVWSSEPGSYVVHGGNRAWIHVLEGVVFVTNGQDRSSSKRCVAGDTIVLPAGWYGYVDVMETAKKLWTVAQ